MTEEPIDFSALDSAADRKRWEGVVERTRERASLAVAAGQPQGPLLVIADWVRPILAAAALALAILVPAEVALEWREERREQVARLVRLTTALSPERPPTASDFLRALGERMRP
jgi:hypothetical protein